MLTKKMVMALGLLVSATLLSGCGDSSPPALVDTAFVQACMKQANPGNVADDKRKAVCGCIETDGLGKVADADVKKLLSDTMLIAGTDAAKMQSELAAKMANIASDPAKMKNYQDGVVAFSAAAGECAKKAI